jgi:hypothetical protein
MLISVGKKNHKILTDAKINIFASVFLLVGSLFNILHAAHCIDEPRNADSNISQPAFHSSQTLPYIHTSQRVGKNQELYYHRVDANFNFAVTIGTQSNSISSFLKRNDKTISQYLLFAAISPHQFSASL